MEVPGFASRDVGPEITDGDRSDAGAFPHERVRKHWLSKLEFAEAVNRQNKKDGEEAAAWFEGGVDNEWKGTDPDFWNGIQVATNTWHRDVNILTSFLLHSDPRILVNATKGEEFEPTAKAMEKLAMKTYREMRYRDETKRALIEALFRNRSFVFQGWDSYRGLPTIRWCAEEVYLDPDSFGDIKRAGWIAEQYTARLEDLLDDPEIAEDIKKDLKEKKNLHQFTRPDQDRTVNEGGMSPTSDPRVWDNQPGFTKIVAYRIFSREGLLPGYRGEKKEEIVEVDPGFDSNPHLPVPPPERPIDAAPAPQKSDPIDSGRRKFILLIKGYDKVVKVSDWHMNHFDRDEFPYEMLKLTELPGDLNGVPTFKIVRPLLRTMNYIISFEMAEARATARRLIEADTGKIVEAGEFEKIESGKHLEVIKTSGVGAINMVEFKGRNPRNIEFYQLMRQMHDEVTGVNDTIRGQATVEKTATESNLLHDSAQAAFSSLTDAVEVFHENIARRTVMALQRYVPTQTVFAPCEECGVPCETCLENGELTPDCPQCGGIGITKGPGFVAGKELSQMTMAGPMAVPCEKCQGSGLDNEAVAEGRPIQKGADWWLPPELAQAWRGDITVEQIRTEVAIEVEPGSTRRDYHERRFTLVQQLYQLLQPMYTQMQLIRPLSELTEEVVKATELPNAEALAPTQDEWMQSIQMLQAQAMAAAGPSPEDQANQKQQEADAQAQEKALEAEESHRRDMEKQEAAAALKQQELDAHAAIENRKIDISERQAQAEAAPADLTNVIAQAAQTVALLGGAISEVHSASTEIAGAVAALAQAAEALKVAAAAPKRVVMNRAPGGRIESAEIVSEAA